MAASQVRLRIDHPAMRAYVGKVSQAAVDRAAEVTRQRYSNNIIARGRVNTGKMSSTVTTAPIPGRPWYRPGAAIGTPVPYAKYQEYGTRAHGPVRAKFLRFKPKGSSTYVFAKWVRGVTPAKFARDALDMLRPSDFAR